MEDAAEKIIVYEAYDTVMMANLAKTKLDAYGVPCFLTEENFTGWYPFRNQIFPGVRLHIFEKDLESVKEILAEIRMETDPTTCPQCAGQNVTIKDTEHADGWHLLPVNLFISSIPANKKVYHCIDCKHDWE